MKVKVISFCVLFAVSPMSLAADAPGGKTTAKDVSRTIRDYTVAQRDEATKSAKAALDDMDAGIRRLERKLEREWDQMDAAARKKARATLDALRRERNELAEWYGGLKYSSAEAWDEVKSGFAKSYDDLKGAFGRARKAF
jgi:Skp family chaperone for outer membrane proteins